MPATSCSTFQLDKKWSLDRKEGSPLLNISWVDPLHPLLILKCWCVCRILWVRDRSVDCLSTIYLFTRLSSPIRPFPNVFYREKLVSSLRDCRHGADGQIQHSCHPRLVALACFSCSPLFSFFLPALNFFLEWRNRFAVAAPKRESIYKHRRAARSPCYIEWSCWWMADLIRLAWKRLGAEAATLRVRDIAPVDPKKSRNDIFFILFPWFIQRKKKNGERWHGPHRADSICVEKEWQFSLVLASGIVKDCERESFAWPCLFRLACKRVLSLLDDGGV